MHYIFLLTTIFSLCLRSEVDFYRNDCKKFHSGLFIYKEEIFRGVKIKRTQKEQVETIGDTLTTFFNIEWKSNCSYNLIPNKVVYHSNENALPKDTICVTIIEILSDSSYHYRAIVKKDTTEYTMIKIKQ